MNPIQAAEVLDIINGLWPNWNDKNKNRTVLQVQAWNQKLEGSKASVEQCREAAFDAYAEAGNYHTPKIELFLTKLRVVMSRQGAAAAEEEDGPCKESRFWIVDKSRHYATCLCYGSRRLPDYETQKKHAIDRCYECERMYKGGPWVVVEALTKYDALAQAIPAIGYEWERLGRLNASRMAAGQKISLDDVASTVVGSVSPARAYRNARTQPAKYRSASSTRARALPGISPGSGGGPPGQEEQSQPGEDPPSDPGATEVQETPGIPAPERDSEAHQH